MTLVFALIVGVLIGIITSFAAWWILFRYFTPRLLFSYEISKIAASGTNTNSTYCMKLVNSGRRQIIDLEMVARLRIRGVDSRAPKNWHIVELKINRNKIPKVKPGGDATILVYPIDLVEFQRMIFPDEIQLNAPKPDLSLEDLLGLGTAAELRLMAFGYDGFSGARRYFESHDYNADSIKGGFFEFEGLHVVPRPDSNQEDDRS